MSEQLVITALGDDRPGIVNELSEALFKRRLNLEDSRMSVLGGEFAILLLVGGDKRDIDSFIKNTSEIEDLLKMKLMVKTTSTQADETQLAQYNINVDAIDNPSIVHNLASFFSDRQINIIDLETERYAAPHTGTPMFSLHMTVGIPADMPIDNITNEFMATCDALNLDAQLAKAA